MRLLLLPVLIGAAALVACSRQEAVPDPVRAVRTLTVTAQTASGVSEYAGEVRARTESRLGFRVGELGFEVAGVEIEERLRVGGKRVGTAERQ